MATNRTYRVLLVASRVNDRGQFCSDGSFVDSRILTASSLDGLLVEIKRLVTACGTDCRAYVQICGSKRPSTGFREWAVNNLIHIVAQSC